MIRRMLLTMLPGVGPKTFVFIVTIANSDELTELNETSDEASREDLLGGPTEPSPMY